MHYIDQKCVLLFDGDETMDLHVAVYAARSVLAAVAENARVDVDVSKHCQNLYMLLETAFRKCFKGAVDQRLLDDIDKLVASVTVFSNEKSDRTLLSDLRDMYHAEHRDRPDARLRAVLAGATVRISTLLKENEELKNARRA